MEQNRISWNKISDILEQYRKYFYSPLHLTLHDNIDQIPTNICLCTAICLHAVNIHHLEIHGMSNSTRIIAIKN